VVQLKWKADPAREKEWRGIDGRPCSDGFFIMKGVPAGSPEKIPPKTEGLLQDKYLATMTGKTMVEIMTAHGSPELSTTCSARARVSCPWQSGLTNPVRLGNGDAQ
jgi:hypothetical protein